MMYLGCNSADIAGAGALKKFNSLDALKRLKVALKNEKMEGFLNDLSEGTLDLVINDKFFVNETQVAQGIAGQEHYYIEIYRASGTNEIKGKPLGQLLVMEKALNYSLDGSKPLDSLDTENVEAYQDPAPPIEEPSSGDGWYAIAALAIIGTLIYSNRK